MNTHKCTSDFVVSESKIIFKGPFSRFFAEKLFNYLMFGQTLTEVKKGMLKMNFILGEIS